MTTKVRMMIAGVTLVGVLALVSWTGPSYAGDKDLKTTIAKIAAAIKKGDKDGAKKMAKDAAKNIEDLGDLMHLFKSRSKGGLGFGSKKVVTNDAKDGIEAMIRDFARGDGGAIAAKNPGAVEETGYWIAALAEVAAAKEPAKDQGKKTKKNWGLWSADMRDSGIEFAKSGAQVKAAATKVNNSCNSCHSVFKE